MIPEAAVESPQRTPISSVLQVIWIGLKAALVILGLLWVVSWLWGKLFWFSASTEIMKHAPSPDGSASAFLVRHNPGAMSSFIYTVRLSPSGVTPEDGRLIIRGAQMEGLEFRWAGPRELHLRVPCGHFSDATNYFGDGSRNLWINIRWEFERPDCYYPQPYEVVE